MRISTIYTVIAANFKIWWFKLIRRTDKLRPYKMLINLTNACQSRCDFCDIWQIDSKSPDLKAKEINIDHIRSLLTDLKDDIVWLALSGGEVTLVPYFKEMMTMAKEICPKLKIITFTTNALAVKKVYEYADHVKSLGIDSFINISLDGDEKIHDQLRGVPGNYRKCLEVHKGLKERGIQSHFGLTVGAKNYDFLKNEYKKWNKDIKAITFVHSGGIYGKENAEDNKIIFEGMREVYKHYVLDSFSEIIEKIHIKVGLFFIQNKMKKDIIPCEVMHSTVHIMPYGEIQPCMFYCHG